MKDIRIIIRDRMKHERPVELVIEKCLRSVPGRRAVYEGAHDGQSVIIKVFSSPLHGRRHFRRELRGLRTLADRGIDTAKILAYGRHKGDWVLVLEKIENASDILTLFQSTTGATAKKTFLPGMLRHLAEIHQAGVLQKDFHPGNFLWDGSTVYTIDPGQMRFVSRPVNRLHSFRQIAALWGIFSAYSYNEKKELFGWYFQERKWPFDDAVLNRIEKISQKLNRRGIERALKKTLRTCTHFVRHKNSHYVGVFNRSIFEHQDLSGVMAGLDESMETGQILKRGNTCFVSKVRVGKRDVVVKRYNHKGLWHSLRHTIKGSRAKKCWLFGHRLNWLGIATAKPLAYIEQRRFGLIRQSYILNDYIDGPGIREYLNQPGLDEQNRREVRNKTRALLLKVAEHRITHGDLKATNILVHKGEPVLIDLDSMKRHRCRWLLRLYQRKMENKIQEQGL